VDGMLLLKYPLLQSHFWQWKAFTQVSFTQVFFFLNRAWCASNTCLALSFHSKALLVS
jgi:hypothetical protein